MEAFLKSGIFYTDISFSNLIIDDMGKLYIIDFEYCKVNGQYNLPDILSGCIGFYPYDYESIDENRVIYAVAALLLHMEYFKSFLQCVEEDKEVELFSHLKQNYYKNSVFSKIYDNAFSMKYKNFNQFFEDVKRMEETMNLPRSTPIHIKEGCL